MVPARAMTIELSYYAGGLPCGQLVRNVTSNPDGTWSDTLAHLPDETAVQVVADDPVDRLPRDHSTWFAMTRPPLGSATSGKFCGLGADRKGCGIHFQSGSVYSSVEVTGAWGRPAMPFFVRGVIRDRWTSLSSVAPAGVSPRVCSAIKVA
ncbi:hypothetical protein CGZ93_15555 [Enemella dayhoffiae]|uniref:Uncharacterized protein n=1 Tax=Enemella dayhoffiae TaxID=2016507 RepID=A0A255GRH7_9ACTN|nr:hypothetical protein [Enemella dayhoffiae]OYO18399.1 hypothetical protein CGZ93_15555 [Enemella dayhoffiae]